jgi:two-component system response regulator FixJ
MHGEPAVSANTTVHIVDDDPSVRRSLDRLLNSAGFEPKAYSTPFEFLENYSADSAGCVLLDIRMPGMDGLEMQAQLRRLAFDLPVIMMTAQGDVATAVRAMKAGAIDYIEKPFDDTRLINAIKLALNRSDAEQANEMAEAAVKISSLSSREREVLDALVVGRSNKVIAHDLQISVRTVEVHRANMLERLGARGLGEAVRFAVLASFDR